MSFKMEIYSTKNESPEGWDVSELAHDISYTTSLAGQPGKLTFTLEKDPNDELSISVGSLVKFWHNDNPVFFGNVFTIGTDSTNAYEVSCYDQMRYLQNHGNWVVSDMSLKQAFEYVCSKVGINNWRIVGDIDESIKIGEKVFVDATYYDMLQYCIDFVNSYGLTSQVEGTKKSSKKHEVHVGDVIKFKGGKVYKGDGSTKYSEKPAQIAVVIACWSNGDGGQCYINGFGTDKAVGLVSYDDIDFGDNDTTGIESQVEVYYYLHDNFGCLEMKELKYDLMSGESDIYIIGDESLLTDYHYEVDIDKNTYNEFVFEYNAKNEKAEKTNEQVNQKQLIGAIQAGAVISKTGTKLDGTTIGDDTIPKWGRLIKLVTVNDISNTDLLAEYMKLNVEHFNQPSRSLKLNALGVDGMYAGNGFMISLDKLKINYPVYVLSATHNYNGDEHTMELEVNTNSSMKVLT